MARLKDDFPGFAELDAAGEATMAKVRQRIANNTLTEIPGIGPATAEKIKTAFEELDTPADQAKDSAEIEDDANITPASQARDVAKRTEATSPTAAPPPQESLNERIARAIDEQDAHALENLRGELDEQIRSEKQQGNTVVNEGGVAASAVAAGEAESEKSGAEKNEDLANHDLAELTTAERERAGVRESVAERIAHCGAVYVHDPAGPYASRTAVRIPQGAVRIKVEPIGYVPPQKGMTVRDGDDEYAIQEDLGPDSKGDDWLKVRSPNTGKAFIR